VVVPRILAGGKGAAGDLFSEGEGGEVDDLTDEELVEQRRHLRALGYID
jgi:hypothetical protein